MNKLEELIKELCPDGVEYKPLEKCCNILDNKRKPVTKSERISGEYPYYGANGVQDYVSAYIFDGTYVLVGEDGSVVTPNGNPIVNWAQGKIWVNNHAHIIEEKEGILLRFLYHYIQTINVSALIHGNIPKLTGGDFRALSIPVPPFPVQIEIVSILNSFLELIAELTAELAARKKQYEYYLDNLLNIDGRTYSLEEVCQIVDCPHTTPKWQLAGIPVIRNYNLVDGTIDMSNISYINEEEYQTRIKRITPNKDDILFSREAPIGNVGIIPDNFVCCQGQRVVLLRPHQDVVIPRYLLYILQAAVVRDQILKVKTMGSTVSNFNIGDLKQLNFSIPAIPIQKNIVGKLDIFSNFCNDMVLGLPAEIKARRKQYEYYRDILLRFKNIGDNK